LTLRMETLRGRTGWAVMGHIDVVTRPRWEAAMLIAPQAGEDVHLDLSQLRFIDASGTGLMVGAAADLALRDRQLILHSPPAALMRVLGLMWPDARITTSIDDHV
jgi:anti-anti-sigma factor